MTNDDDGDNSLLTSSSEDSYNSEGEISLKFRLIIRMFTKNIRAIKSYFDVKIHLSLRPSERESCEISQKIDGNFRWGEHDSVSMEWEREWRTYCIECWLYTGRPTTRGEISTKFLVNNFLWACYIKFPNKLENSWHEDLSERFT